LAPFGFLFGNRILSKPAPPPLHQPSTTTGTPSDNGREFCGKELQHPFELYLVISQVRHRHTEVRSSETNGFCERFHRTVKEEFFSVAFRKTLYESVEQLQTDLDKYLDFYNRERAHQGYRTKGRTPYQAFLDGVNNMLQERVA
jgi:hypothetical protein